MTEAEWLTCRNNLKMLELLRPRLSDRKLRLFQVACCRRMWDLIPDERWRESVLVAERYADKDATDKMRIAARNRLWNPHSPREIHLSALHAVGVATQKTMERRKFLSYGGAAAVVGEAARSACDPTTSEHAHAVAYGNEHKAEADLIRDIFGNPFRPLTFSPSWRTDTAVTLARQMYESRDFSAMPILADALQDAGCDSDNILSHCRDPNAVHVRGCWVVDLVLGKE
jgi:hypothetical protein